MVENRLEEIGLAPPEHHHLPAHLEGECYFWAASDDRTPVLSLVPGAATWRECCKIPNHAFSTIIVL